MAAAINRFNFDTKLETLKLEIIQTFDELYKCLTSQKENLMSRLARMKEAHDKNVELEFAIEQLKISKDSLVNLMTSNLLGKDLRILKEEFEGKIRMREELKIKVENLELIEFRCLSVKIRNSIEEIDLVELIPEYLGREKPVLTNCRRGRAAGELNNARGVSVDTIREEIYIADRSNRRIQVLSREGSYIRSFGYEDLMEPRGVCVSQGAVFVTDRARKCLVKFSTEGDFIKQTGSSGTAPGCFTFISGLCCSTWFVYVCDSSVQRIQQFDTCLNFKKMFGYKEVVSPADINFRCDTLYVLSKELNTIYCYNEDCTYLRKIELTAQEQRMTAALFFTIDKRGNFLITDNILSEIRIFSPEGILKHILGKGQLHFSTGIVLDSWDRIICVCDGEDSNCFQIY